MVVKPGRLTSTSPRGPSEKGSERIWIPLLCTYSCGSVWKALVSTHRMSYSKASSEGILFPVRGRYYFDECWRFPCLHTTVSGGDVMWVIERRQNWCQNRKRVSLENKRKFGGIRSRRIETAWNSIGEPSFSDIMDLLHFAKFLASGS